MLLVFLSVCPAHRFMLLLSISGKSACLLAQKKEKERIYDGLSNTVLQDVVVPLSQSFLRGGK